MTFDLEKARACAVFVEPKEAFLEALDEIERLWAENAWLKSDREFQSEEQAARIKELEADLEQSEICIQARLDVIDQQAARIGELEAQLTITNVALENATRKPNVVYITGTGELGPDAKPREGLYGKYHIAKADGSPVDPEADYFVLRLDTDPVARRAAREYSYMTVDRKLALDLQERITKYNPKMMDCINLQFFGVEKPRVWQITEERKAALWHAIKVLKENDIMEEPEEHLWDEEVTVLQAMLKEAE